MLQLKVLIVDPSDMEKDMLMSVLGERNCDIDIAQTMEEGLKKAGRCRPDIIIADHGLQLDGAELCRQVRMNPELADIPVVLMSSFSLCARTDMVGLFRAGCDQVLSRPFRPRDLHTAIQSALMREEFGTLIPVLHRTGEITMTSPKSLDQLIVSGTVLCFKRHDTIADVDCDRIRSGQPRHDYCGPERRRQP